MRIGGDAGGIWEALGAVKVNMPGGKLNAAMASGELEGLEWMGPWHDQMMHFSDHAPYMYSLGTTTHEPGSALSFVLNKDTYDSLTDHERYVIKTACDAMNMKGFAEFEYQNTMNHEKFASNVRELPDDVATAFANAAQARLDELAQHDDLTARVVKSVRDFEAKHAKWRSYWGVSPERR